MSHHMDVYSVYAFIDGLHKLFQIPDDIVITRHHKINARPQVRERISLNELYTIGKGRFSSLYSKNID